MQKQTFIFCGRSGCGKGTQAKLLKEYLAKNHPEISIFEFSTGDSFRKFFEENTYASNLAKSITDRGALQPLFLTIAMWGDAFIKRLKPDDTIFIDGYPRVREEAVAVASMLSFFERKNPIVIDFIVSRESSKQRMQKRGRADDTPDNIETRLDWYEHNVVPAIEYLTKQPGFVYWAIDGERPIEPIHEDIISRVKKLS